MRATVSRWLEAIRSSFWFLPMLMLVFSTVLAQSLLHLDRSFDPGTEATFAWAYSSGPEGARSLLSTIAGSMITAASVTFSLASVALSIASQQYGSRVLRNFMRDRITQVLLGTFIATFIYSVLVVRQIRGTDISGGFVPAVSVTAAIVLSLASLVLLVYFIHHISASIQASHVVRSVGVDLESAIPRLYPSDTGSPGGQDDDAQAAAKRRGVSRLAIRKSGYLQTIDLDTLMKVASELDCVLEILVRPGDHLLEGDAVLEVAGRNAVDGKPLRKLQRAFFVDRERTPAQDIRYQFQQLTDVIVRALSPGINDPFTAISGIHELTVTLVQFALRAQVDARRRDPRGQLRLVVPAADFSGLLENTIGHIAIYAASDHFVMDTLRRALDYVVPHLWESEALQRVSQLRAELDQRERHNAA